jgi:hypothetical protein
MFQHGFLGKAVEFDKSKFTVELAATVRGWGGWAMLGPDRFIPGKDPVPIVWEAGWVPGPVWTAAEKSPTGIRSLVRPVRNTVEFNTNQQLVYGQFILLGCGAIYSGIWLVTFMRGFLLLLKHHEERSRKVCLV